MSSRVALWSALQGASFIDMVLHCDLVRGYVRQNSASVRAQLCKKEK